MTNLLGLTGFQYVNHGLDPDPGPQGRESASEGTGVVKRR